MAEGIVVKSGEIVLEPGELYHVRGEYAGPWGVRIFDDAMYVLRETHTYGLNAGDWFAFAFSDNPRDSIKRLRIRVKDAKLNEREVYTPHEAFASDLIESTHTPIVERFVAEAKRLVAKTQRPDIDLAYSQLNETINLLDEIRETIQNAECNREDLVIKLRTFLCSQEPGIRRALLRYSIDKTR